VKAAAAIAKKIWLASHHRRLLAKASTGAKENLELLLPAAAWRRLIRLKNLMICGSGVKICMQSLHSLSENRKYREL